MLGIHNGMLICFIGVQPLQTGAKTNEQGLTICQHHSSEQMGEISEQKESTGNELKLRRCNCKPENIYFLNLVVIGMELDREIFEFAVVASSRSTLYVYTIVCACTHVLPGGSFS